MSLDRRDFLARLGWLAGAAALAPLTGCRLRSGPAGNAVNLDVGRPGLGTWVRVVVRDRDGARASRAVERAFAAIREVDAQMSIHRPETEISRVNAAAGRGAVHVSPAVLDVAQRACAAAERSGGVYDPTVLELMRLYGFYGSGRNRFPAPSEVGAVLEPMGWRHVEIDAAHGKLGLRRAGAGLDFGSIGKGWAVDRAVQALRDEGIQSGLVDVGGNVYGLGSPADAEGWSVGVFHPKTGLMSKVFVLRDCAVATSANSEQYRVLSGIRVGHLYDARRGRPSDGHLSATVQAATGVESDVMSTAAFLLGPDRFRGWPGALDAHFIG